MDYDKQIDYSSLETYLTCPRKFLFRYVMHLVPTGPPSLDLVFGSCWHYGMEQAFQELQAQTSLDPINLTDRAVGAFNKMWLVEGTPWFDPDAAFPKNPGHAADMFHKFFTEWGHFYRDTDTQIVGVEQPFTISLNAAADNNHSYPDYIGRLDLVLLRENKTVEIVDHKTAKFANDTTFNTYTASLQTDGYLTAGHMFYDSLPIISYLVALCQKTKMDFTIHQISRRSAAIERFLDDLLAFTTEIRNNLVIYQDELTKPEARDKIYNPRCFRRKPGYACTMYFRKCEYYDICLTRNNPLLWVTEPPQGYAYDEWHPDKITPEAKLGKEATWPLQEYFEEKGGTNED